MDLSREQHWLLEEKYGGTESAEFARDCARLAAGEPLAYVIGSIPFLGLTIYLDSKPLIPRPETEWWAEQVAAHCSGIPEPRILDLCAGSGAIGCALLKMVPGAQVSFGELEPRHAATIRRNIRENTLDAERADIRIGDLFTPFAGEKFDLIVANPPYVPTGRALPASVAGFEPAEALSAGPKGLAIIKRIAQELPTFLAKSGTAWIECDTDHAKEAAGLFRAERFEARIEPDQYGAARVIVIS